jgi:hypothetical protein
MRVFRLPTAILLLALCLSATSQKRIFIPQDLRQMNLDADSSKWCWHRSAETRDCIFFWERGFGSDLQAPPPIEGKPMSFNLSVLMERVQSFYTFFHDTLGFVTNANSKANRYKMMVMVNYSLEGTAYGGTYDNFIGALWVAPNRIQDKTMNCMAHELGHSFQLQIPADSVGEAWGGSGFYEMTSQWMLWQVNPWWLRDENYHFEAFKKLTHKAYLDGENIYHSPYVIQWWSDLRGRKSIAELYRQGRRGEDPVMTYKRMFGLTQEQFCDEMMRGYQHLVNFDFHHARCETRPYACTFSTELDTLQGGWMKPVNTPEAYGFNAIALPASRSVAIQMRGSRELRWGFVGITTEDREIYSPVGATSFRAPKGQTFRKLYLIVMGAPREHQMLTWNGYGERKSPNPTYPYELKIIRQK